MPFAQGLFGNLALVGDLQLWFVDQNDRLNRASQRHKLVIRLPNWTQSLGDLRWITVPPWWNRSAKFAHLDGWMVLRLSAVLHISPHKAVRQHGAKLLPATRELERMPSGQAGFQTSNFQIWCKHMGVSENSIPLNPMVNDHYPY